MERAPPRRAVLAHNDVDRRRSRTRAGTVLAKWHGSAAHKTALDLGSKERLLALLTVAYRRAVAPSVIGNIRRAARDWAAGQPVLAQIHLARSGLPRLEEGEAAPFRLFAAERLIEQGTSARNLLKSLDLDTGGLDLLKAGFTPDEPRVPAGNPDGGKWTDGGETTADPTIRQQPLLIPAADRGPAGKPFPADKDPFFDTLYRPVHATARRLGIDETWLLGLAAHEGGWLEDPHNREINNPFGVTHGGGRDVHYASMDEAVEAWERRYGSVVRGATGAADFVRRLFLAGYNKRDPQWSDKVIGAINSVERRLDSWQSRHNL